MGRHKESKTRKHWRCGNAIQNFAEKVYSVVRDFCGHGIGKVFHTAPNVLHYGEKGKGMELKKGMIFTIEPTLI